MSDSKKAQNLARIRDNQRRSRARRKEYLQELEAKLRDCEHVGIEASAEIQTAARRVLDENRKLRALLHERGVPDSDIILAMGGSTDRSYDQISAAPSLNLMLERRITCDRPTFRTSPVSPHCANARMTPHTPAPLAIPVARSAAMSSNDSPSPHSIVSSTGTPPPSFHGTPYLHDSLTPAPEMKPQDVPPYIPYDQPFHDSWVQPHPHHQQYVNEPVGYYNTSCVDAANIIRTMRTDAGPELEAELGCRIGQHCYVNNSVVFNVMDRYASPQGV